jgi:hypothetical protein
MTSQRNPAWAFWSLCTLLVAWGALFVEAPIVKTASAALLSLFFPGHALARWVAGRLVAYGLFLSLPGVRNVDAVIALSATSVLLYPGTS